MSDDGHTLLPESHSFPVRMDDGHTVDLRPLANELLTARRNQMQDAEFESPTDPGIIARAGFETGVYAAVRSICGQDALDAFRRHCDEMWGSGQG